VESEQYATWRATLAAVPGRQPRILAWAASTDGGLVILSPAVVSERSDGDWRHTGWHEIERGGWNAETGRLHWQTYAGRRAAVALADPGRLPGVFKERVDASIVFEQFVPLTTGSDRGVVVNGRRDLSDGATSIGWHATLTRGVSWRTPGVRDLADEAVAELRREYDEG
jgi:hypothetical protein